ncbi:hypothetical protein N0O92_21260 [Alkalihalobacillus sp. MEB130]|uniref:hypothetical protein n=1 Tax=Alkalihalobacillus sp. MEB130 TaxID=2976704 RepID=UPI0028DFDCB4|nr:hypothetical protein [Alkalihalobacillus sp. MEB130]MDT8862722.1 hypothetical protein [Alkalihalobacillus sp. MEB130]
MKQWLEKCKEFGYHFLDLLFTLEYEHIDKDTKGKKNSMDHESLSDSNSVN